MPPATYHIVGAGLAGLAAAVEATALGARVVLHEAAAQAGGRCRSLHDPALDRLIDNGNHLLLGANRAALGFLARTGGVSALESPAEPGLPFHDLATGAYWRLEPGDGPGWLFDPVRCVPGSRPWHYLAALRPAWAGPGATVADCLPLDSLLGRCLWRPLAVSILNTDPAEASARLLWPVFRRTLLGGAAACRPYLAGPAGLSGAFVDPALSWLARHGACIRFGQRLRGLDIEGGRVTALAFADERLELGAQDRLVLAVPAGMAAALLPGLTVPQAHRAILNAHFRLDGTVPALPPITGLVGGVAEWLFRRGDVLSLTVSAADGLMDLPADALAAKLWREIAPLAGRADAPCPPFRIIKERRATFAATSAEAARRPGTGVSGISNLALAGDWTDTGLPATIEGAILSGQKAARLLAGRLEAGD